MLMMVMLGTETPCRATEKGCGGDGSADVIVLVLMGVVLLAVISRFVWNRWHRGPYPFILRLMRFGPRK